MTDTIGSLRLSPARCLTHLYRSGPSPGGNRRWFLRRRSCPLFGVEHPRLHSRSPWLKYRAAYARPCEPKPLISHLVSDEVFPASVTSDANGDEDCLDAAQASP